jgi:hypothetical protein
MRIIEVDAPAALSVACPAVLLATGGRERIALESVAGVERVAKQITGHRGIHCYWYSTLVEWTDTRVEAVTVPGDCRTGRGNPPAHARTRWWLRF